MKPVAYLSAVLGFISVAVSIVTLNIGGAVLGVLAIIGACAMLLLSEIRQQLARMESRLARQEQLQRDAIASEAGEPDAMALEERSIGDEEALKYISPDRAR